MTGIMESFEANELIKINGNKDNEIKVLQGKVKKLTLLCERLLEHIAEHERYGLELQRRKWSSGLK